MRRLFVIAIMASLLLSACEVPKPALRIGAKGFGEQTILAHILKEWLAQHGLRASLVECGDTYGCQQALRRADVDMMVEYTGTALALGGFTAGERGADLDRIRAIYGQSGLRWMEPLGFNNAYAVVVPTARAAALNLESIADLTRFEGGIRVATPTDYARRAGDGLFPLLRHYGLTLAEPPLMLDDPGARYGALLEGRADAAIAYTTDGALSGRRLRILNDPAEFFSDYEAAVVVRQATLARYPQLAGLLGEVEGRIGTPTMQQLNAHLQLKGESPVAVARSFLREAGLRARAAVVPSARTELIVVRHSGDRLEAEADRVLRVVDQAFPERAARLQEVPDPIRQLSLGNARLAVVGSERFFIDADGGEVKRDRRLDAVGVIGTRTVHVVRRETDGRSIFAGKVGLVPAGSGAAKISEQVLAAFGGSQPAMRAEATDLFQAVADRDLDVALIVAETPDPEIAEGLARLDRLELKALPSPPPELALRAPYLRAARIPPGTYSGQARAVTSVASQSIIAGPSPRAAGGTHLGGPGAALRTSGVPLTGREVEAVVAATPAGELPDPVLPSPWSMRPAGAEQRGLEWSALVDKGLNIAVWIFLAWLLALLVRRPRGAGRDKG